MSKRRIFLSPGYHAEPGETRGHQHDVYTTIPPLHGNTRLHVGTLMKSAVEAWRDAAVLSAPGMEAGTATPEGRGAEHESPVAESEAPARMDRASREDGVSQPRPEAASPVNDASSTPAEDHQ